MTCLLQYIEVVSATPRLEPGVLATSTKSGPDAVDTESVYERGTKNKQYYNLLYGLEEQILIVFSGLYCYY